MKLFMTRNRATNQSALNIQNDSCVQWSSVVTETKTHISSKESCWPSSALLVTNDSSVLEVPRLITGRPMFLRYLVKFPANYH